MLISEKMKKMDSAEADIFIVEDERIVAKDVESRLKAMGYTVCGISSSAEEALPKIETLQ